MSKSTAEILREARGYIEKGWTQGSYAKDATGRRTGAEFPESVCWCSLGALYRAAPYPIDEGPAMKLLAKAQGVERGHEVASWNDTPGRTQAEVLEAFDKAIALAEGETQ